MPKRTVSSTLFWARFQYRLLTSNQDTNVLLYMAFENEIFGQKKLQLITVGHNTGKTTTIQTRDSFHCPAGRYSM